MHSLRHVVLKLIYPIIMLREGLIELLIDLRLDLHQPLIELRLALLGQRRSCKG